MKIKTEIVQSSSFLIKPHSMYVHVHVHVRVTLNPRHMCEGYGSPKVHVYECESVCLLHVPVTFILKTS